jgi:hypothetical protein
MSNGCSTRRGTTSIGDAGSWRGINDGSPQLSRLSILTASPNRGRSFRKLPGLWSASKKAAEIPQRLWSTGSIRSPRVAHRDAWRDEARHCFIIAVTVKTVVLTKGQATSPKARPIISAIARSAGPTSTCAISTKMLAHLHDQEIEIGGGPEPPPRETT